VLGKRLDQRSDIFSLGVTLWTVLAGEPLFAATTTERTLENVLREPVRAPSLLGSKQLAQLDRVCLRALERDPSRRYSSAQAMLKDFRSAVARMGLTPDRELVRNWVTEAHRSAHGGHAGTHRWATLGNEFLLTSLQSEIQALPDPRPSYHRTIGWALSGGVLLIAALALYWWRTT
jgi:serine/threonine protein kinase